ncbi:hypothetical protein [Geminocystis sp. GBBB08]|uniref:hypothetical protein n=1 Tax=Geminocystis sp. GBBB08 TaxID=2604140 RepID=UPI0027E2581A|nr:hypothetical protein [Geminocystis sp. GBBB08]MBL1208958.1 hypothetical protein [Geminocystis sp. GBBB08]
MNLTLFFNWRNLKHSFFVIFGFLLSPLCWWNDLIFNLPIAYGFGKIVSFFFPNLLIPASIVGYWLTNIIGIILMQLGTTNLIKDSQKEVDLKKNIWSGVATSTVFTVAVVVLWKTNILDLSLPSFLTTGINF